MVFFMEKKKIMILSSLLVVAFTMIASLSYALWQMTLVQESTNVVTIGCFEIAFQDLNPIHLEKLFQSRMKKE